MTFQSPIKFLCVFAFLYSALSLSSCTSNDAPVNSSLDNKEVGVLSTGLLSSSRFDKLILELLVVEGQEPHDTSIQNLISFLDSTIHKPKGIEVVTTVVPSNVLTSYTLNDVKVLEANNRTKFTEGKTAAVSLLFADKAFAEDINEDRTLGLAYANTSIVLFQKTIISMSNEVVEPNRTMLETAVLMHQFGHIMGLVNSGAAMQTPHQDGVHGKHCSNVNCIMHWETEKGVFVNKLFKLGEVPKFDLNCLNDLKANGGK